MSFRAVFIALVIGTALLVAAYTINWYRPRIVTEQPTAELVRASGKCAECHANLQYSVVHEYELSVHARKKINCLECHQPADGQKSHDHHGFVITAHVTAANCRSCHEPIYQQYLRSRIYVAHSTNLFRHGAEYIPFFFSLTAPLVLLAALLAWKWQASANIWRLLGHCVGWASVAVGIVGLIFHLESRFFREETLESLVYAAPFAAPLAYTGIGLLLIMNRMVDAESADWPYWVLFLALGGFVGNFLFSLTDHAQNGFLHPSEWVPVASSAFAVGFLLVPFLIRINRSFLAVCAGVMLLQAAVGLLGFYYHTAANLHGPSPSQFDNFVYGAPAMAPLLFPNLVLLAFLGLWVLRQYAPANDAER